MTIIHIESETDGEVQRLVQSAIAAEVSRLELALALADERLAPFETKYGVTSAYFMAEMAAEDLEGADEEYVQWAGEFQLRQRLAEKLQQLKEIRYSNADHQ